MKEVMGVIGYPIQHSLSPEMHTAAFKELNLEMAYHAYEVSPGQLENAVAGVKGLGLKGLNVTIPHKVNILSFLDRIDDLAEEIGAVNTVVNENGQLVGYNTDGEGYFKSILSMIHGDLKEMNVLIIGAGGASRAVAITLAKYGVNKMVITNRTQSKAMELVEKCSKFGQACFASIEEVEKELGQYQLIINTTSIGMDPNVDQIPMTLESLQPGTYVSDLIYTPLKTKWLQEAENKGAVISNGLDMFIYQGALAFERWTGEKAPIEVMRDAVLKTLG